MFIWVLGKFPSWKIPTKKIPTWDIPNHVFNSKLLKEALFTSPINEGRESVHVHPPPWTKNVLYLQNGLEFFHESLAMLKQYACFN